MEKQIQQTRIKESKWCFCSKSSGDWFCRDYLKIRRELKKQKRIKVDLNKLILVQKQYKSFIDVERGINDSSVF